MKSRRHSKLMSLFGVSMSFERHLSMPLSAHFGEEVLVNLLNWFQIFLGATPLAVFCFDR